MKHTLKMVGVSQCWFLSVRFIMLDFKYTEFNYYKTPLIKSEFVTV